MADMFVSVLLETSPGVFLELENPAAGLEIGGGSFASRSVTHSQEASKNTWVEGSIVTASVRDDIVEPLEVKIDGHGSHYVFEQLYAAIVEAFEQLTYTIVRTVWDARITWTCKPADHQLSTQKEFQHATVGVLLAQVPRAPTAVTVYAPRPILFPSLVTWPTSTEFPTTGPIPALLL